jgi:hypothetical protein
MQGISQVWGANPGPLFEVGSFYDSEPKTTKQANFSLQTGQKFGLEAANIPKGLQDRIVGIVKKKDLEDSTKCSFLRDEYAVIGLLKDQFENLSSDYTLNHLPESFKTERILPEGTGLALSSKLVITAGHVAKHAFEAYVVVQYRLEGNRIAGKQIYEIEDYGDIKQSSDQTKDLDIYESNLKSGDWAILKLRGEIRDRNDQALGSFLDEVADERIFKSAQEVFTLGHPYGLPLKQVKGQIKEHLTYQ